MSRSSLPIPSSINHAALLRLSQVLSLVPVSKSTWWNGVRSGRFPRPVKLSQRTTCWRASEILRLIEDAERPANPVLPERPRGRYQAHASPHTNNRPPP